MPSTTASRFLAVGVAEPNLNTGMVVKILDYKDMKTLVAFCPEFTALSFTQELSGTGTGSITLDQDSPWWSNIMNNGHSNRSVLNHEYVFEVWDNGTPRFAWLAQTVTNAVVGEDETRVVTISGPGGGQVLTWAPINRPGWPATPPTVDYVTDPVTNVKTPIARSSSASDKLPALTWRFPIDWPTMRMWYTVFKAAQRRGLLPFVSLMFSATQDSGRQDFQLVKTIETIAENEGFAPPDLNENLLDFLNDCTGQDYSKWFGQRLEWIMHPGFKLDVRRRIGADLSRSVRFFSGNILADERTRDRESIANRVIVVDDEGHETVRLDSKSVAAWNLRETRNEDHKNVTDSKLRGQVADRLIQESKNEKDEWSIRIPWDDPGRRPFRNFNVGDYIGVNDNSIGLTPTNTNAPTKYRVMAITVNLTAEQTVPDCELTLQSMIDSKLKELEKKITQIINDPASFDLEAIKNISIPTTPKVSSALTYDPAKKKWVTTPTSTFGSGSGGGVCFSDTDPATVAGNTIKAGDFWYDTGDSG